VKLLDQFSGLIASAMLSSHFPEQIITFHCDELKASPKVHIQTKATEELLHGSVCNAIQTLRAGYSNEFQLKSRFNDWTSKTFYEGQFK